MLINIEAITQILRDAFPLGAELTAAPNFYGVCFSITALTQDGEAMAFRWVATSDEVARSTSATFLNDFRRNVRRLRSIMDTHECCTAQKTSGYAPSTPPANVDLQRALVVDFVKARESRIRDKTNDDH